MESTRWLLLSGALLLSLAAFMGFAQFHARAVPERAARWRVVHVGGTAGAVQLLALAAVWPRGLGGIGAAVAAGLIAATWAFFLGPLATALGRPRLGDVINRAGGVLAVPAYLALPLLLARA